MIENLLERIKTAYGTGAVHDGFVVDTALIAQDFIVVAKLSGMSLEQTIAALRDTWSTVEVELIIPDSAKH